MSSSLLALAMPALLSSCAAPSDAVAGHTEEVDSVEQALVANAKQVAYVPLWGTVDPSKIPWDKVTHLNLAFLGVNLSHQCAWVNASFATDTASQSAADQYIRYRNANFPSVKILLSVGGWTMSPMFSESMNSTNRSTFVSSCVSLVNDIGTGVGVDGLDIDWEYPTSLGAGNCPGGHTCASSSDPANYTATLNSFRANGSFGTGKLLTAALRGNTAGDHPIPYEYQNFFTGSPRRFDWVNLMTYDYHGSWESATGFTAPYASVTAAMDYAVKGPNGVDDTTDGVGSANKGRVVMGVPFYGAVWANAGNCVGCGGTPLGTMSYRDAKALDSAYSSCSTVSSSSDRYIFCSGAANITYINTAGTLITGQSQSNVFVSYDNTSVVGTKMDYVANNNYGGAMWWAQGWDSTNNDLAITIENKLYPPTSTTWYTLKNGTSNKCLDNTGGSLTNDTQMVQWTCGSANSNQKWKFVDVGGGYYHIINQTSGMCLDNGGSTTDNTYIEQYNCVTSQNLEWSLVDLGSSNYQIKSHKSGKCIDDAGGSTADGNKMVQYTCSTANNNQKWLRQAAQ
jgi:GH18 family chitinase